MTFSYEDRRPRLTVRVDPSLKRQVEAQPGSISEFVREAVRAHLPSDDDFDGEIPDDPELARVYSSIRRMVFTGWVRDDAVLGKLAQQFSMEKPLVRRYLVTPLVRGGYLKMRTDSTGRFTSYKVVKK